MDQNFHAVLVILTASVPALLVAIFGFLVLRRLYSDLETKNQELVSLVRSSVTESRNVSLALRSLASTISNRDLDIP